MSDSELEIVVDDPTAPEADSPAVTDVRVVDVAVSLLLALVAATLGYDNWRTGIGWDSTGPQAGYFPFSVSLILAGACLFGLSLQLRAWQDGDDPFVRRNQFKRVLQVFLPTLFFVPVTQWLGIYVASFALIAGFMYFIGHIKAWKAVVTGYVFSAAMFLIFEIAFNVVMPKGPLERAFGY